MEVIVSKSSSHNRRYIREALKTHDRRGERAYLIVPEQFTMESDLALLKTLEKKAVFDIRVHSFTSLSREVSERLGGDGHIPILETGRAMLLRSILLESNDNLHIFKDALGQSGMINRLLELFETLRLGKLPADTLVSLLQDENLGELFSFKLQDLSLLYTLYEKEVTSIYLDTAQKLMYLTNHLPEASWLKETYFYIDGFLGFNQLEYEVLEALENLGVSIVVSLIGDKAVLDLPFHLHKYLFQASITTYKQLNRLAKNRLEVTYLGEVEGHCLGERASELFSYKKDEGQEVPKNLYLTQGITMEDEVHEALSFIRREIIDKGKKYRDFAIVVTDGQTYLPLLKRLATSYQLPIFIDERQSAIHHPLGKYFANTLNLLAYDLRLVEVMACLKSKFFLLEEEEILAFENYVKRRKLRGKTFFAEESYAFDESYYEDRKDKTYYQKEAFLAQKVGMCLSERFALIYKLSRKKASVRDFAEHFYQLVVDERFRLALGAWEENSTRANLKEENEAIFKGLNTILDELVEALGEKKVTFKTFATILLEGLETLKIGLLPPAQDQVLVGELGHIRSMDVAWQMILGLTDTFYPTNFEQQGLFGAKEESYLANRGFEVVLGSEYKQASERLALYDNLTRGQEGLYLSYALKSTKGESMHPAFIIKRLRQLYPALEVSSSLNYTKESLVYSPPRALVKTMANLRAYQKGELSLKEGQYYYAFYQSFIKNDVQKATFLKKGYEGEYRRFNLPQDITHKLYRGFSKEHMKMSISQLEKFRACPFAHFVRYGLRPKTLETYDIEKRELGSFIHDGIEAFGSYIQAHYDTLESLSEEALRIFLRTVFEDGAKARFEHHRLSSPRNQFFLKRSKENLYDLMLGIIEQMKASRFRQVGQEVHFGQRGTLAPIYLHLGEEVIALEGFIDRIDRATFAENSAVIVIDYKTGQKEIDLSKLLDGLDLQLMLYLMAASQNQDEPAGAFYLHLSDALLEVDFREKEEILQAFKKTLLLDGIVINKPEILKAIDKNYDEKNPTVLRFYGRKKEVIEKDNVLSTDQLTYLLDHAKRRATENLEAMYHGEIKVFPYQTSKENACTFCTYKAICAFEANNSEAYRLVEPMDWASLEKMVGGEKEDV